MAYKKDEKSLNADIDLELFQRFEEQRSLRGQVKKETVEAAISLWVQLPVEWQARIMDKTRSRESMSEIVRDLVDQHMTEMLQSLTSQQKAILDADAKQTRRKIGKTK